MSTYMRDNDFIFRAAHSMNMRWKAAWTHMVFLFSFFFFSFLYHFVWEEGRKDGWQTLLLDNSSTFEFNGFFTQKNLGDAAGTYGQLQLDILRYSKGSRGHWSKCDGQKWSKKKITTFSSDTTRPSALAQNSAPLTVTSQRASVTPK